MSDFIKTGVIGHPIGHSRSPLIHNYWIGRGAVQGTYDAIDIPCENLESGVQDLIAQGYQGFNVTIPHKESIANLCDELDDVAKAVGAVNTVSVRDGRLYGANTDVFGFVENIKQKAPDFNFTAGKAVVLGAGGAARAVVQGLIQEGVPEIHIVNRTRARAESLVENISGSAKIIIHDWKDRSQTLAGANILINTTSLGMEGQPALNIDLWALSVDTLVCDIVYAPLYTELLEVAQNKGCSVVTGIGMLLHQARPAFEGWFGVMPDIDDELEKLVLG